MSGTIKNVETKSFVHLYLSGSESELDVDEAHTNVRNETQTGIGHSPRINRIAVDDGSRKRKLPKVVGFKADSQPEATSRGFSPEIPYAGIPVRYKIRKSGGEFLIIKVPMNKERSRSKKCSDRDIANILDSESDDDVIFEGSEKKGANVVGSLPVINENAERTGPSREKMANRAASSNRFSSKDVVGRRTSRLFETSEEDKEEEERVSLRLKLRRSTEQSNYTVQTIFDNDEGTRRSSRRSKVATPKKCALGDCREDDHGRKKKTQTLSKSPTSSMTPKRRRAKNLFEPMEDMDMPITMGKRLRSYGRSDYDRDLQRLSEIGERHSGSRSAKFLSTNRNAAEEAPTPRSLRARRNSTQINHNEHDYDNIDNNLDKENQSENDLEEDSDSVAARDCTREQSSRSVVRSSRKERQILEQPSTSKSSSNSVALSIEEDSGSVTPRGRKRQQLFRSAVDTPRTERLILEEPSSPKRTPRQRVRPDAQQNTSNCKTPRASTLRQISTPRTERQVLEEPSSPKRTPRQIVLPDTQQSTSNCRTPRTSTLRTERLISEEPSSPKRTPRQRVLSDAQQNTSNCKTPRTSTLRQIREETVTPTTPRGTPGGKRTSTLVNTPSMTRGNLTPSMSRRTANIHKPTTVLGEARAKLHVSAVPKSLPCREREFNDIYQFLERKLLDNNGGCIYISGVPGTGKTATVNEAIRCLKKLVAKGDLDHFDFVEINGMKLSEPRQAYVQILKQISGEITSWEQAYNILETRFTGPSSKRPMMLLLVDELDLLCTKRQDVVYNLLDWPAKENARLVVITIANTMDLPERVLMGRVTSRLGLTRLTFQPYTHVQLKEIVAARLKESDAFKSDAVELVARKVGAVSGDARRALDICRRATEIAELRGERIVSMKDVNEAVMEMIIGSKVQAIRHRSDMEKMFLRAVAAEVTRTGVEEVTFANVFIQLQSLCLFEGLEVPNVTVALGICARLGASRLLLCDHSRNDIQQRILLNVSHDDLHFAMNIRNIE